MPYIGRGIQTGEYKLITLTESFDGNREILCLNLYHQKSFISNIIKGYYNIGEMHILYQVLLLHSQPHQVSGESIKILKLGDTLNIATPSQNTVGIAQLSTSGISTGKVFKVNDAGNAF